MTTPADDTTLPSTSHLVWRTGLAVAVIALAGNLLIFVLARAFGSALETQMTGQVAVYVGIGQIIPFSIFPVALGTLLLWLLRSRGAQIWTVLALVGAVLALLSTLGPLTLAQTAGSLVALVSMHLLTGAVWTILLLRGRRAVRAVGAASRPALR